MILEKRYNFFLSEGYSHQIFKLVLVREVSEVQTNLKGFDDDIFVRSHGFGNRV